MQGAENQVTGKRGLNGNFCRLTIPNLPHHIESTGLETFSSLSPSRGAYRTKIVAIVQKINSPRLVSLRVSNT